MAAHLGGFGRIQHRPDFRQKQKYLGFKEMSDLIMQTKVSTAAETLNVMVAIPKSAHSSPVGAYCI